jgi:hypothetical protein
MLHVSWFGVCHFHTSLCQKDKFQVGRALKEANDNPTDSKGMARSGESLYGLRHWSSTLTGSIVSVSNTPYTDKPFGLSAKQNYLEISTVESNHRPTRYCGREATTINGMQMAFTLTAMSWVSQIFGTSRDN